MNNVTTFQIKARAMLCTSLTVLLAACGGGSGGETTASGTQNLDPVYLSSVNANPKSNGYVAPTTTTSTTPTATTSTTSTTTSTTPTATTSTTSTTTSTTPTTTASTTTTTSVNNYYVATTGSDSNPGTQAAPFLTIAHADAVASAGYTINVAPGTYTVNAPTNNNSVPGILTTKSGTSSAHIRFVSTVKWGAKIVVTGIGAAWNSKGSYVDIDGFDITGSGNTGILAQGAHLKITNNHIHDLTISNGCNSYGGGGIINDSTVGDAYISNNIVINIGVAIKETCNFYHAIYIASPNDIVINNIASGANQGINQWHGGTAATIVNNTVFNNHNGINLGQGDSGALPGGAQNNYLANNIIYDNTSYGIVEGGTVGANNLYVNNLVYSNGTNMRVAGAVSGTISANPMFVNYQKNGSGDYHTQSSSPAIDKGSPTNAPSTDLSGTARPRGAGIDIGAYEY